jgi:hypothetical protein
VATGTNGTTETKEGNDMLVDKVTVTEVRD